MADYALSFDGEDDYVEAPNVIQSKTFTVAILVRLTSPDVPNDVTILDTRDKFYGAGGKGISIDDINEDGIYQVRIGDGTTVISAGSMKLDDFDWHFIATTADEATLNVYFDETLHKTVDISSLGDIYASSTMTLGSIFSGGGNFPGNIALVLIYNRALSDTEIQQIYSDPLNPPTDGLILWLAPDSVDTANNVWTDKSGQGNDGTIYGCLYIPTRWTTKDGVLTIEEIWELNTVRFNYPWPVSITNKLNRTVKIVPTLGGSPVVFDTGLSSEEVTFSFYILPSELSTFRDLAQVGGIITIRTPDLDYYGDYIIKDVDWSIDRMSAYQVRITAVRV